jgi:hypothetical protein
MTAIGAKAWVAALYDTYVTTAIGNRERRGLEAGAGADDRRRLALIPVVAAGARRTCVHPSARPR